MATKKKLLQAAAGSAGGAGGLDVSEVFSTYLYEGNGSTQTITNDIDLSGEGGLVWMQVRNVAGGNRLVDSENGNNYLRTHSTSNLTSIGSPAFTLNSNGFTVPNGATAWNESGNDYASWTFRKAPKFFDVVTYTGDGVAGRSISHNLNGNVGMILFKRTDSTSNWIVWHRSAGGAYGFLDATDAFTADSGISNPTTTAFTIESTINAGWNASGGSYVAYLFAHNNGDASFGPDGDADIIKCGTYEGNGGTQDIDLGFEPQWVMIKNIESRSYQAELDWNIFDNMREWANRTSGDNDVLIANGSDAETALARCFPTANGFAFYNDGAYSLNVSGDTYIYIAIRRGPMAVPEDATDVFDVETSTSGAPRTWSSGFPVDLSIYCHRDTYTSNKYVGTRLTGNNAYLVTNGTSAEGSISNAVEFDYSDKIIENNLGDTNSKVNWMWRRAPNFFDVVAYTGDSVSGSAKSHNLGVAPEMIWVKNRNNANDWNVWHSALSATQSLRLNLTNAVENNSWFTTLPTDQYFYPNNYQGINQSGYNYIAYLFASLDGVSKVGSYTGTGAAQNIDCGFSNGARFILIKRTDSADGWFVHDTERGIVTGNDPYLQLNTTDAEAGGNDIVDPYSAGFTVNNFSGWNASGGSYIFYAIA